MGWTMSSIEVIFNTDNAAFEEDAFVEIQHVLNRAKAYACRPSGEYRLHDSNSNTIGFVRITDDRTRR
jgi:hypothetical protein